MKEVAKIELVCAEELYVYLDYTLMPIWVCILRPDECGEVMSNQSKNDLNVVILLTGGFPYLHKH